MAVTIAKQKQAAAVFVSLSFRMSSVLTLGYVPGFSVGIPALAPGL